ncbi:endonuclease VIII [Halioglobus japonicus]|uniref:DNA-(apurinic or apyrimidinic site) lyase n=1 Tax=Halioglobus japonicus TaxID=930805 RepID=A0AAP8MC45_9GAMM|nr:endonuclease VIII [Halioglobus japonicus]AQA17116.1 endonuclease VIII [Halioglobus japonicus]PLW85025.1 endonuclease VIII [Halioglobus japonicus]GHD19087.1 endonuclease 8 [Halioglobus japonicus]
MPEGPEIRRAADAIGDVLVGEVVDTVRFGLPRLRKYARQLRGQKVVDVETRGKAMLTHFDHGYSIYSHNQLYGVWQVVEGKKLPNTTRSMRLLLQTADHSAILYSASDISVWPTEELSEHPFLQKLGPDIMDRRLTWRAVAARLEDARFAGKSLSVLYLDQVFLAGNGNYLRSEILFDAGLDPKRTAADLTRGERGRLARSTLDISRRSYDTGGITLAPQLSNSLQRQGLTREWRRFYVFGRADYPCYRCGSEIRREEVGSRRLYTCPGCQPRDAG